MKTCPIQDNPISSKRDTERPFEIHFCCRKSQKEELCLSFLMPPFTLYQYP